MTLPENEFRRRLLVALERIADALEAANEADPVRAIAAALGGEEPHRLMGDEGVLWEEPLEQARDRVEYDMRQQYALAKEIADLPPAQRRAMGLE